MVSVYKTTHNGKPAWRAVRTVTERFVQDGTQVKRKKQIKGTAPTARLAEQRLEEAYRRYLVKAGQLDVSALTQTEKALELTVAEWMDTYLTRRGNQSRANAKKSVSDKVLTRYRQTVRDHIAPHIGHIPIRLLSQADIEKLLYVTLPAKKKVRKNAAGEKVITNEQLLGNSPMRKIYDLLNGALNEAVKDQVILRSPMTNIPRIEKTDPKDEDLGKKTWMPERIMEKLHGSGEEARWILAFYGLRQSERLGITYSSFTYLTNPKKRTLLHIKQQLDDPGGGIENFVLKPSTKTKAGKRVIPLPDDVTKMLLAWKKQQDEWKKQPSWRPVKGLEDLFFTTPEGKPIRHGTDTKQWHALLKRTNLDYVRGHGMRHIAATLLARAGVSSAIAQEILGWNNEMMRQHYTHLIVEDRIKPVEGMTARILSDYNKKNNLSAADAKKPVVDKNAELLARAAALREEAEALLRKAAEVEAGSNDYT